MSFCRRIYICAMTNSIRPSKKNLEASAAASFDNGFRLLEEKYALEFSDQYSTRFYNAMIAQEEFAKAFMLLLIRDDVIPFTPHVLRAMNDHVCKQLVGMIMDYVIMHWDETDAYVAMIQKDFELGDRFPNNVGCALEILRYDKIGRWESKWWSWGEDPNYDKSALDVADGKRDRRKQDALYVRIGKDGRVLSIPASTRKDETTEEEERAGRYGDLVRSALQGDGGNHRYEKTVAALKCLFAEPR
jgi:hypothetical protein